MKRYCIKGMSCAACAARIEKTVSGLPGVESCSVNLLTNTMGIEGDVSEKDVMKAVRKAGYSASVERITEDKTPSLVRRLALSLTLLVVLMFLSMHTEGTSSAIAQCALCLAVMFINGRFFVSGTKVALHLSPNMDTLVSLGALASFAYSLWALLAGRNEFYFETVAMILTLISIGKLLETRAKGRTTDALKSLVKLSPKVATVIRDGKETEVPVEAVRVGDVFVVRAGESIPVDGVVEDGVGTVDESALTGESVPVDKTKGDGVCAATINRSGFIRCRASKVGEDTTIARIIRLVSDTAATKAPMAKLADKVSAVFVPVVLAIAVVVFVVWMLLGAEVGKALSFAVAVLVVSCPCALGLATPVAITVGSGVGAKKGILFKTAEALETAGKVTTVVLDKTGTVTKGEINVTDIEFVSEERELLRHAHALETKSEHPLAKAVVREVEEKHPDLVFADGISEFETHVGAGVSGMIGDEVLLGGNARFVASEGIEIPEEIKRKAEALSLEGKTPLFFACNGKLEGMIAVTDKVRDNAPSAVKELQDMSVKVIMLTGDNERTAKAVGRVVGIEEVISSVLPDGKAKEVDKLKNTGVVAMVGDGINDAPALVSSDTGIAIGAGADIAIDAADVVLVKNDLTDIPFALKIGRAVLRNIRQNLFWAFFYNIICIPLAAGVFYGALGWRLSPEIGAAAMSLSSFCVVVNSLRLNKLSK